MISRTAEPLKISEFDYDLPESLIAQEPCSVRDRSRLMILNRAVGSIGHRVFCEIADDLMPGDLLVLNNTRVVPCRIPAKKQSGGKAEIFLLAEQGTNRWTALVKGGVPVGKSVRLTSGIEAVITADNGNGTWNVEFQGVHDLRAVLCKIAQTPLPPYIKREPSREDRERYQTVYAAYDGAVAAPTAGLHFTPELLGRLAAKGVEMAFLTLHVGPGTFQPVRTDAISEHRMPPERYEIPDQTAAAINNAKAEARRVVAVGTTSARALETAAQSEARVIPGRGNSGLFIYPGYQFRIIDALITNFHLPKSTLLMLVSAFAGKDLVLEAYRTAVSEQYRFYSYGDAMFIF